MTNIDFLRTLLGLDAVVSGDLDTSLIDNLDEDQLAHTATVIDREMAATAVLVTAGRAGTDLTGAITKPTCRALSETQRQQETRHQPRRGGDLLPGEPHVRISVLSWS